MKTLFKKYRFLFGMALILLVAVTIYSCDDFLTSPPQGSLDENTLANQNGVEGSLIAAYRNLDWNEGVGGDWGASASNWVWGSVTSDDAYKGSEADDQPPVTDVELYNWTTGQADDYINDKWRAVYEGVNRANSTISLLTTLQETNPDEIPAPDAESIRGEALFLRAHYHFEAWQMWENVPYYTEEDEDFRKPNVDGATVIGNILNDLDEAISLLPDSPRRGENGRVDSWDARAYKGRVEVHSGDYAAGLATLREVRNSGEFELQDNFHQVWTGFSEFYNGPETILAYQASANDGQPDGNNANYGNRLNFPHSGSPYGCCGFHQGTQNLVNFFQVDGSGLPLAMANPSEAFDATASWNSRDDEFDASLNDVPVDPRLDWTVGRDGVPFKDRGLHEAGWIRQESFGGPYSGKKNTHEAASDAESNVGWVPTQLNSVNTHIYRYADALLLLAEAEVEAGDLENAREIVNEIRERAGVAAQGPGDERSTIAVDPEDPSITWADYEIGTYDIPWVDQDFARQAVRTERRLELAMEGQRFFDLKRWGIFMDVLNPYIQVEQDRRNFLNAAAEVTARYLRYPIPTDQIELSEVEDESRLEQNDGW